MKNILYLLLAVFVLTSCEDFLDAQSYTKKNSETFPITEEDATQMLTGVYSTMNTAVNNPATTYFLIAELVSGERFGGGGANDKDFQAIAHLMCSNGNQFSAFWSARYVGIARANAALAALESMSDGDLKNQKRGEALFLRSLFYFELTQLFGDIPLMKSAPENVQQAQESPEQVSQEEIYKQIGTDLLEAYNIMPASKWDAVLSGTATKWAAAGLLARVYLFYTGFYGKDALATETGSITNDIVVKALEDCINNSGHSLVPDYRSLWVYSNKTTKKDYPYDNNVPEWVRDGSNPEHVFDIKFMHMTAWASFTGFGNGYCLYFGIRADGAGDRYRNIFPLGQGWGAGPVSPVIWDEWAREEPNDIRRKASIYSIDEEAVGNYAYGADSQMEETGLWQKKYVATTAYKVGDANSTDFELFNTFGSSPDYYDDPTGDDFQVSHEVDLCYIRFADILLMHSELTKTATGLNQVRHRVGLPDVAYSDAALRKERRYELAFEGLRWGDIRRWGIAEQILNKNYGATIWNSGQQTTQKAQSSGGIVERYKATKGFFIIPQSEVDLANGALKQNAGWGADAVFSSWK